MTLDKILKSSLKGLLPPGTVVALRNKRDRLKVKAASIASDPKQFGRSEVLHECPICGYRGRFWSFGTPPRPSAMCPECLSLERHRLLHILLETDLSTYAAKGRILHFAPEDFIKDRFAGSGRYFSTDLSGFNVDLAASMDALPFPDHSFQMVIANHVLEHVPDDHLALTEIRRVTLSAGLVLLSVPQIAAWGRTYEDSELSDPNARRLHFGQEDHRRLYGRDFKRRLVRAGFRVETFQAGYKNEVHYGLSRGEAIYIARPSFTVV